MGTQVTHVGTEQEAITFPKLMISRKGTVVLFSKPQVGTVIVKGEGGGTDFAEHDKSWIMSLFTDCKDQFLLQTIDTFKE